MTTITGGCLCGAVRYEISAEPLTMRVCWCRDCRRFAGNGSPNALFRRDAVTLTGTLATFSRSADSGNVVDMKFCAACGSQVFGEIAAKPGFMTVRAGTFDDSSLFKPVANIWVSSAPNWACMNEDIPKFERQPPPPTAK